MNTEYSGSGESSVMFNLRQLMELEAERLSGEAEAERAAQRAAEQRRTDALRAADAARLAEERAAAECARQTSLEAQRIEREREASLLRARLRAEADARLELERLAVERDRIALEHARAIQREPPRRSALRLAAMAASLGAAVFAGGAAHAVLLAPQPSAVETRELDTRSATLQPQPTTPAAREQASSSLGPQGHGPEGAEARSREPAVRTVRPASQITRPALPKPPRAPGPRVGSHRPAHPNNLDDIDLTSDDPLEM